MARGPPGLLEAERIDPARTGVLRADWFDMVLICLFLLGLDSNYTIQISTNVPFPSAPAGVAGLILLWRRRNQISPIGLAGLVGVLLLFLISVLCATNINYLARRTNGLIQLSYSIVIGYALFLTITQASRQQIAGLFLGFAGVILIGCLLENYAGLRPISDDVRKVLYSRGNLPDREGRLAMFRILSLAVVIALTIAVVGSVAVATFIGVLLQHLMRWSFPVICQSPG